MKKILCALLPAISLFSVLNTNAQNSKIKTSSIKYIDPANMDPSIKPGDNFYLYANGTWLKKNAVPASKTRWGSFDILRQTSLERLRDLCEGADTSKNRVARRVADMYASAMDSSTIEKAGYTPIKAELERLQALQTKEQILN